MKNNVTMAILPSVSVMKRVNLVYLAIRVWKWAWCIGVVYPMQVNGLHPFTDRGKWKQTGVAWPSCTFPSVYSSDTGSQTQTGVVYPMQWLAGRSQPFCNNGVEGMDWHTVKNVRVNNFGP